MATMENAAPAPSPSNSHASSNIRKRRRKSLDNEDVKVKEKTNDDQQAKKMKKKVALSGEVELPSSDTKEHEDGDIRKRRRKSDNGYKMVQDKINKDGKKKQMKETVAFPCEVELFPSSDDKEDADADVSKRRRKSDNGDKKLKEKIKEHGTAKKSKKKVTFPSEVELFPSADTNEDEDDDNRKRRRKSDNEEKKVEEKNKEDGKATDNGDENAEEKINEDGKATDNVDKNAEEEMNKDGKGKKKKKKVTFSSEVEQFPSSEAENNRDDGDEDELIYGRWFSTEEDQIILDGIQRFVEKNQLGVDGKKMLLNTKKNPQARGCWKEIGALLPKRPELSVRKRGHILIQRSDVRKWTPEEYETIRRFHAENGPQWSKLAKQLSKSSIHVKDTWRRIKLPNLKKGHWSQDEYQSLFDLVNLDLRVKAFQEKPEDHRLLRDNISWEAISTKLTTRTQSNCCLKWYQQLSSSMVQEGLWDDVDDYRLLLALLKKDTSCEEDVDWDNLLKHRSGEICRKRWKQMIRHIGGYREKPFIEQLEILSLRYCPEMIEYRK